MSSLFTVFAEKFGRKVEINFVEEICEAWMHEGWNHD